MSLEIEYKKVGRKPKEIIYKEVLYNNNYYIVGCISTNKDIIKFLIDKDDFPKIKDMSWHYISKSYVSHSVNVSNKRKELYLHNLIMNRTEYPGKGSYESVDHINRIGLDNRKDNLRIISQSEQNINQKIKKRRIKLPENSEITENDIPKHIWYIRANGNHGDRFAVELKTENIIWKTTSSKNISLKDKLEDAKQKLNEYYKLYPYLNPKENNIQIEKLQNEYYEIISLI